jgi:tetratricopeptide (TPR) repeat protein
MFNRWFGRVKEKNVAPVNSPPDSGTSSRSPAAARTIPINMPGRDLTQIQRDFDGLSTMISAGHWPQAKRELDRMLIAYPAEAAYLRLRQGELYQLSGAFTDAILTLEEVTAADSRNGRAQKLLAAAYMSTGNGAKAVATGLVARNLLAPDAEIENLLGVAFASQGKVEEAFYHLHRAIELDPDSLQTLFNLCELEYRFSGVNGTHARRETTERAREAMCDRLLKKQGSNATLAPIETETLLYLLFRSHERFSQGMALAKILASDAQSLSNNAAMLISRAFGVAGNLQDALRLNDMIATRSPDVPEASIALGNNLLSEGGDRWIEGWRRVANGTRAAFPGIYANEVPQWDGAEIPQGKLFVYQEQGFGDLLIGLRLVPILQARGIKVVLWVDAQIARLAQQTPGIDTFVDDKVRPDPRRFGCVASAALFSLPALLNTDLAQMKTPPVLEAPTPLSGDLRAVIAHGKERASRLRIGIAAIGNPRRADDWLRTIPTQALTPLTELKNIDWVNLSVDRRPETDEAVFLLGMEDPTPQLKDFCDTAALIASLDGVVAIDCSAAHLAATLGKPVWVLVPSMLDWRWQVGQDAQPWWPMARTFRSEAPGVWIAAVTRLREDLGAFQATR